ncbi:MAG: galactose oxidase-like domain-containing protein [Nocardioidaceae bacterium]
MPPSALRRAALTGLCIGVLALPALDATMASSGTGSAPVMTGESERDGAGPTTAHVDTAHATVAAAREAAHAAHQHSASASTTSTASVTANATALDPAVYGEWTTLSYELPLRAVHATLLRTGKFLLVAGSGNVRSDNVIGQFKAYLWDPESGALTSVPVPYDAFCAGHVVDANGDVIVFGGTVKYKDASNPWIGSSKAYKFNVATSTWTALPPMAQGRWYPTGILDGSNRLFVYSGKDGKGATPSTAEMFDPATGKWSAAARRTLPLYPGLTLFADGRLFYNGAHYGNTNGTVAPKLFNPVTGAKVTASDPNNILDLAHRTAAMGALVGSADRGLVWVAGGGFPAVSSSYFFNLKASTLAPVAGPKLPAAKGYVSISLLPDLTALETGGGTGTDTPVFESSILNPTSRTLTSVAPNTVPRTYHSSSITMPDGRVATFGGDPSGNANFEFRIEIYSPPYVFKGTRPVVTSAVTQVKYGGTYSVGASATGATPATAVLMRPGSATHALDANQRVLQLASSTTATGLSVTLPTKGNLAPPGWYLLFVNDSLGRPSVGRWVHLS